MTVKEIKNPFVQMPPLYSIFHAVQTQPYMTDEKQSKILNYLRKHNKKHQIFFIDMIEGLRSGMEASDEIYTLIPVSYTHLTLPTKA